MSGSEARLQRISGKRDPRHPLLVEMEHWGKLNIADRLQLLELPQHYDFGGLRLTPAQTRVRGEKAPKPSVRDPPSGIFCSVRSDMERLLLSQGRKE